MQERIYGIDIFRIMCCLGVLVYHIVDDVLGVGGRTGYALYFLASFCVPGFFLSSGYLLGGRDDVNISYIENKIINVMVKLFGWIVFWIAIHFIRTEELYGVWDNFTAGVADGGILPVSWFLFTYCVLLIAGYPLYYLSKKYPYILNSIAILWVSALALGYGRNIMYTRKQSLWIYLYLGYFCVGIALNHVNGKILKKYGRKGKIVGLIIANMGCLIVYTYKVMNAETFSLPYRYYGRWFYTLWLVSLFLIVLQIRINNKNVQRVISRVASNTFVVYLGHLPILLYVTSYYPLTGIGMAAIYVLFFFIGTEILAEVFRKLPLLRKLV